MIQEAASLRAVIVSQTVYTGSGKAEALARSPFTEGKAAPSKEIELLDRKADSCLISLPHWATHLKTPVYRTKGKLAKQFHSRLSYAWKIQDYRFKNSHEVFVQFLLLWIPIIFILPLYTCMSLFSYMYMCATHSWWIVKHFSTVYKPKQLPVRVLKCN